MATNTQSEGTEGRALSAALASPAPFTSRAASMALHASGRHVDRWAPEQGAVARSRALGALSFVDRLLMPWMTATAAVQPTLLTGAPAVTASERMARHAPASWLFPRPWFQDELDWMAADREAADQARGGLLTTRGTYSAPMAPTAPMGMVRTAGQAVVAVADELPRRGLPVPAVSLEYVAPSLAASGPRAGGGPATPVARALRAWSAQVPFAAAQAAEVMAATVAVAEQAGLASAGRSPLLEGLSYVVPSELASDLAQVGAPASTPLARTAAQLAAVQAVARARDAETARASVTATAVPRVAPGPAGAGDESIRAAAVEAAYRAEQARVLEAPDAGVRDGVQLASSSTAAAQAMRTVELFARGALAGQVAPASGPRVALPAGLGGALVGLDAAAAAQHSPYPMPGSAIAPSETPIVAPRARGFAPVWAATPAARALSAVDGARPAAMDHLAWADRWLARMAGASPASLAAIDVASERAIGMPRALLAGVPEVVYVRPDLGEPAGRAGDAAMTARGAATPALVRPAPVPSTPTEALRIDDGDATPDAVLAAIARAARPRPRMVDASRTETARAEARVAERAAERARAEERAAEAAAVEVGPTKPTIADRIARTAPLAPAAGLHPGLASSPMAPALAAMLPLPTAPVFDPRALFGAGLLAAYGGGVLARDAFHPALAATAAAWMHVGAMPGDATLGIAARAPQPTWIAPDARGEIGPAGVGATGAPASGAARAAAGGAAAPMWTVRAPLLLPAEDAGTTGETAIAHGAALHAPLTELVAPAWTARPGMTAELAHDFSVRHERAAADLAFDFVSPEVVLAARVYGFGAAEAAQAARLAVAGPAGLAAMASAIDLTFLRQLHVEAERRETPATTASVAGRAPAMPAVALGAAPEAPFAPVTAWPSAPSPRAGTVFGVDRRLPRGAFLWPAGAVAALGLGADGAEAVAGAPTVAALELLAAGAVAAMGAPGALVAAREADPERAARIAGIAMPMVAPAEPSVDDVAEHVAPPERARFQSIYLALSQSAAGRAMSPSVRAARALAIAASQEPAESPHERARAAWSVMPAVYATPSAPDRDEVTGAEPTASARSRAPELTVVRGEASHAERGSGDDVGDADLRPGLGRLAARAGEAIGSLVRPSGDEVSRASSGAAQVRGEPVHTRAEPFVQELIRTARGFSRVGGGETEIPAWFETAARTMLDQRGLSETISVAELTLIASTSSRQVAASPSGASPAPSMATPPTGASGAEQGEKPDIDKIASEVYAEILRLLDVARERSGDPWL